MARNFAASNNKIVISNFYNPDNGSFTLCGFAKKTTDNTTQMALVQTEDPNGRTLLYWKSGTRKLTSFFGAIEHQGSDLTDLDEWKHYGITLASGAGSVNQKLYVGGDQSGSTASRNPESMTGNYRLGLHKNNSSDLDGDMARWAAWDVELTAEEMKALSLGIPPYKIRPGNLVWWSELDEQGAVDLSGNENNGTLTGTTVSNHPPIMLLTDISKASVIDVVTGGASAISRAVDEVQEIHETVSRHSSLSLSFDEVQEIHENTARRGTSSRAIDELQEIHETIARKGTLSKIVDEIQELHETISRNSAISKVVDELHEIHETVAKVSVISRVIDEIQEIHETIAKSSGMVKVVDELHEIHETISKRMSSFRNVDETQEIHEDTARRGTMTKIVDELHELHETVSKNSIISKAVDEVQNIVETVISKLSVIILQPPKISGTSIAFAGITSGTSIAFTGKVSGQSISLTKVTGNSIARKS